MKTNKELYSLVSSSAILILFLTLISSTATAQSDSPMITLTQITNDTTALSPAIYGDRIVYEDWHNGTYGEYGDYYGNWDIYLYNISTSEKSRINTNKSICITPSIYGDKIVYVNWHNTGHKGDIYMYNISSSKEIRITDSRYASYPQIYGDTVVWLESSDLSDHEGNIYMYNLITSK
jgi:beta propeller repeat protein